MIIVYYDGSTLKCSTIEIRDGYIMADDYRLIHLCDIERIIKED